ncbi:MAG: beta-galactosidase [Candidatus Nealsonbacteria bacterium]|nr:beta-galactosidase [Candidatus Nealsonbacteria bacterium]
MKKNLKKMIFAILIFLFIILGFFFLGSAPQAEEIKWGVNFSQKHSRDMGLEWKENYLALLDDLNVKDLKVAVHWDLIEPEKNEYRFEDLDWQINTAEKRGAKILLVIGMKTPRWPECHLPGWAKNLTRKEQEEKILEMLKNIVLRYKDSKTIYAWQVENEPFFPFGDCPWLHDRKFLKVEIDLVKSLDFQNRPVVISDSGEWSFWFRAARIGDIVGTTMYRKVWFHQLAVYVTYPIPPVFYWRRAQLVEKFFDKKVICVEFQAEPWGPKLLYNLPLAEQEKTMNLEQFRKNIEYAKKTGLKEFYLWGAEWWYWMKEKQNQPEIWNEAKKLFIEIKGETN